MKKIAIVTRGMMLGGIEKSLISMLKCINYNNYKVHLFIVDGGGELEEEIPKEVEIKYILPKSIRESIYENIKAFNLYNIYHLAVIGIGARVIRNRKNLFELIVKNLNEINEQYDIAISYHNPITLPTIYAINNLKAACKLMWVHSDINEYSDIVDDFVEYYEKFDVIFGVSKGVVKEFSARYPKLKNKCKVYYNYIYKDEIKLNCDNSNFSFDSINELNLLTVGRLSWEKGMDKIPKVAKKLVEAKVKFKWYIIGDGQDKDTIYKLIQDYNLENNVILLGKKKNPYNYMRDCNIYIQTSNFESYCLTIAEAKCFEKPIVATKVNGINEQIINNKNGILVENDIDKIYLAIKDVIVNTELRKNLSVNLSMENIDTRKEFIKIERLLNKGISYESK